MSLRITPGELFHRCAVRTAENMIAPFRITADDVNHTPCPLSHVGGRVTSPRTGTRATLDRMLVHPAPSPEPLHRRTVRRATRVVRFPPARGIERIAS